MKYEVIVIGSGPAGLTAGIYLSRFKRKVLIVDGSMPGGQLMWTSAVENWPGEISIDGPELMKKMRAHAEKCGCDFLSDEVERVDFSKKEKVIFTKGEEEYSAEAIIIATGSSPKKLGCPGEEEYWGNGVNVCATCDAPLYDGKEVVVVGGGNSAIAESYALSKHATKVTIIQFLDELTATDPLTDQVKATKNIEIKTGQKVLEIVGDGEHVQHVVLEDQKDKSTSEYPTQGVFVAIGMDPNSKVFKGAIELDDHGYVVETDGQKTSVEGVFVAGDVADFVYRQAVTAAGEGCAAALECERYFVSRDGSF